MLCPYQFKSHRVFVLNRSSSGHIGYATKLRGKVIHEDALREAVTVTSQRRAPYPCGMQRLCQGPPCIPGIVLHNPPFVCTRDRESVRRHCNVMRVHRVWRASPLQVSASIHRHRWSHTAAASAAASASGNLVGITTTAGDPRRNRPTL